ncbi:hypothetical protein [Streptomyces yangpuensis]|uniref:hypothetical protein n=1 Tax=Streptomyces yangpuensis TaxID=1648182 RepID=UPI0037F548D2
MPDHISTPHSAAFMFSALDSPEGGWTMHLVDEQGVMSDVLMSWPAAASPLTLLQRYDALALVGYAPTVGGVDAWQWREGSSEGIGSYWVGTTAVRPVTAEEKAHGDDARRAMLRA